ncbi:MAG: restriction endonuclease subunit S [Selenomonadales bacterium]|nr:restriction endonuclease subunit S [Selenomonadales bacterium]
MAKKFEEIKEEEYPYELPEGWKWERLGKCVNLSANKTELFLDSTKYVGLENIEKDTGIIKYEIGAELKSIKNVFVEGQILYGKLRPYLNKHGIAKFKGVCSTDILVFSANNDVSNKWVDYYFNMPSFISYAISNSTGINLPRVNSKSILSYVIPIPPKETQQKIVDIIESLFAKLDIAQEKVEQVLAESEYRRSAILHNAFSGKLTEKWREENNVSFDSWNEYKIKDIAKNIKDKYDPEKDKFLNIPYIGLEHIEKNNGIVGFSSSEGVKSIKTLFNKNDVLYGKLRPYLDKHDIAEYNGMCSTDIIVYRCELKETAIILNYVMSTNQFIEYAVTNSKGINLPRTSEKIISEYKLQLPLLTEQKEIVRLLDKFLSVEDKVKSTCQNTLEAIATMRKSILAKAFRGELCS